MTDEETQDPGFNVPRSVHRVETLGLWAARLSLDADVVDISAGGLRVRLPFSPPVGAEYAVTLTLLDQTFDAPVAVRDVRMRDEPGSTPTFDVGMEFGTLESAHRSALQRFVAQKLRNS